MKERYALLGFFGVKVQQVIKEVPCNKEHVDVTVMVVEDVGFKRLDDVLGGSFLMSEMDIGGNDVLHSGRYNAAKGPTLVAYV